jgi:hypothetical protein
MERTKSELKNQGTDDLRGKDPEVQCTAEKKGSNSVCNFPRSICELQQCTGLV